MGRRWTSKKATSEDRSATFMALYELAKNPPANTKLHEATFTAILNDIGVEEVAVQLWLAMDSLAKYAPHLILVEE